MNLQQRFVLVLLVGAAAGAKTSAHDPTNPRSPLLRATEAIQ